MFHPNKYGPPRALVDGWLLKQFGGRKTLEELDEMMYGRYRQATDALVIEHLMTTEKLSFDEDQYKDQLIDAMYRILDDSSQ